MRKGDQAIFYHSNAKPPGAAGHLQDRQGGQARPTQFDPTSKYYDPRLEADRAAWDWVTVAPVRPLKRSCRSTTCARCPSSSTARCWPAATASR